MKKLKSILLSAFAFLAVGSIVLGTSCEQDPCTQLTCQNGGRCQSGTCDCPAGYEGSECEIKSTSRFIGVYKGVTRCNYNNVVFPMVYADSAVIRLHEEPNKINLQFFAGTTTIANFIGTAATPDATFETFNNGFVSVHPRLYVDGDIITIYLETITLSSGERQICRFQGVRNKEVIP